MTSSNKLTGTFFSFSLYFSASLLALLLSYSQVVAAPSSAHVHAQASQPGLGLGLRATPGPKLVIIQIFEWSWDSVASECTSFIGPAGYGYVQGVLSVLGSLPLEPNFNFDA
jgi:hypothetical protein